jgi:hypothetical protein
MAMFHCSPNRSSPDNSKVVWWHSVETPSVFKEYAFPEYEGLWTAADKRKMRELEALAEAHGTHVQRHHWRRG